MVNTPLTDPNGYGDHGSDGRPIVLNATKLLKMDWILAYSYNLIGTVTMAFLFLLVQFWRSYSSASNLHHIPTIGPSTPLLSYVGAIQFLFNSSKMIQEGYTKYNHGLFKIATFGSWFVFVSSPQHIEDIRKAPPDVLEFQADIDQALHVLCPNIRESHFHVPIIQAQLTRELNDSFCDIQEEVARAFNELIISRATAEWSKVPTQDTMLTVVCRTAHRLFVGLPLCRDPNYIAFTMRFAVDISRAAAVVKQFPRSVSKFLARPFADAPSALKRMMAYLRPLVEERKKDMERYGKNYPGKPEDLLTWFMDEVDGDSDEERLKHLAFHFLTINFGSVYPTAMSFIQALYHLAAHPECIEPLREEIENVVSREGWTKSAMGEMRKLDSFLKESQRLTGLAAASTYRRVLEPFTFSDGMHVTPSVVIAVAAHSTHLDNAIYPNAATFDGFRFSDMEGDKGFFVTPSLNYLPFGVGRHLCPGRFFTAIVMKVMMSHLILNYDLKLEKEGKRPSNSWFITDNVPDGTAKVMLRKRKHD